MTDFTTRRTMMVDTQVRPSDVTKFPVIDAMLSVPREVYVPNSKKEAAYMSENIDLGAGRVLLEPRTLGKMLDFLDIQSDEMVLDVGVGLGYSSAVIARLAEAVVGVEENSEFIADAQGLLDENNVFNVVLHEGALGAGAPQHGPYDVIIIQGAAGHVPEALLDQLKDGGRIACLFMEGALGIVRIGYKLDGKVTWQYAFNAGAPILPGFERHAAFEL